MNHLASLRIFVCASLLAISPTAFAKKAKNAKAAPAPSESVTKVKEIEVAIPTPAPALIQTAPSENLSRSTKLEVAVLPWQNPLAIERPAYLGALSYTRGSIPGIELGLRLSLSETAWGRVGMNVGASFESLERERSVKAGLTEFSSHQDMHLVRAPVGLEWEPLWLRTPSRSFSVQIGFAFIPVWGSASTSAIADSDSFFGYGTRASLSVSSKLMSRSDLEFFAAFRAGPEQVAKLRRTSLSVSSGLRF